MIFNWVVFYLESRCMWSIIIDSTQNCSGVERDVCLWIEGKGWHRGYNRINQTRWCNTTPQISCLKSCAHLPFLVTCGLGESQKLVPTYLNGHMMGLISLFWYICPMLSLLLSFSKTWWSDRLTASSHTLSLGAGSKANSARTSVCVALGPVCGRVLIAVIRCCKSGDAALWRVGFGLGSMLLQERGSQIQNMEL